MLPKAIRNLPSSELDNYIIQCIREIEASPLYEKKLAYTVVKDGKATLPEDFIRMSSVHYQHREPTNENLQDFALCFDIDEGYDCPPDDILGGLVSTDSTTSDVVLGDNTEFTNRNRLFTIQRSTGEGGTEEVYVARNFAVSSYTADNSYFSDCWLPLKVSKNIYNSCYIDSNSPNWISKCSYTYNLTPCNQLITTLPDGVIQYIYTGRLIDEDGSFLIPDDMTFMRVLIDGVIYLYYQDMRLDHKEGAIGNHREYRQDFYKGVAFLRGRYMLPNTATMDKRLRAIIYHKINIANNYSETGNAGYSGGTLFNHMNFNN